MTKTEKAVTWAIEIANDPAHGYDQDNRWGPDYDCSSLVISAWRTGWCTCKNKRSHLYRKYEIRLSVLRL
ncbi:MAG: hypothetical protein ACLVHS_14945 [Blautia wexlerae]